MAYVKPHRRATKKGKTIVRGHARKTKPKYDYTEKDVGAWIDGAFGESHALAKMAELIRGYNAKLAAEIDEARKKEDYEFSSELLDEGTALLQEHTAPKLVWLWDAGDLLLDIEEDEEGGY